MTVEMFDFRSYETEINMFVYQAHGIDDFQESSIPCAHSKTSAFSFDSLLTIAPPRI
jgi:hypothetical protein